MAGQPLNLMVNQSYGIDQ